MSVECEAEHAYPPSRVVTQDLNFQRAAYPSSNRSTDSLESSESVSARIGNQEKLYQRVFNKLKDWFNRF